MLTWLRRRVARALWYPGAALIVLAGVLDPDVGK